MYRHINLKIFFDGAITAINEHFNQVDYSMHAKLEQVLLLVATNGSYSSKLQEVLDLDSTEMILTSQSLKLSLRCLVIWKSKELEILSHFTIFSSI